MKLKITDLDRAALAKIQKCGFIGLDQNGHTWLETSENVTPLRLRRLVALGMVKASGDALIADIHSQTFTPV